MISFAIIFMGCAIILAAVKIKIAIEKAAYELTVLNANLILASSNQSSCHAEKCRGSGGNSMGWS